MLFRHVLRLVLLVGEFVQLCPPDTTEEEWRGELSDISARLTESCRHVDPTSTDKALGGSGAGDGIRKSPRPPGEGQGKAPVLGCRSLLPPPVSRYFRGGMQLATPTWTFSTGC